KNVEDYYKNYMTSRNAKLVVVGDVTENEILGKLGFLHKLPNKEVKLPATLAFPKADKTKVYVIDIPKAAQTEFRVGAIKDLKYDATGEYYRATLANYPLGGNFNSRVNLNLREDKGWTYGARSGFSADKYTGYFAFSSGIRADVTDKALTEVMNEMTNYATQGITREEIAFMQNSLGQRDALMYETGIQKAGFLDRILEYNLPNNFVDEQNKILANIKKADIDKSVKKWMNPETMNILLVGDKNKIMPGLSNLGYDIIELDVNGNTLSVK
ncbi:MAG TPA: insulinase family protein, partial [Draconibacterium sp.]|nr:insulinase family protein [Draconibacterium sp.]